MNPAPTPRTDGDDRQYPLPEHAQRIVFEGCDSVVVSPEAYEALYEHARTLERELTSAQAALAAKDAAISRKQELIRIREKQLSEATLRAESAEMDFAAKDREIARLQAHNHFVQKQQVEPAIARAEKAEAELANWRGSYNAALDQGLVANSQAQEYRKERDQLAAAKEDTERLDWLEREDGGIVGVTLPGAKMGMTLRAAIDAAREAQP